MGIFIRKFVVFLFFLNIYGSFHSIYSDVTNDTLKFDNSKNVIIKVDLNNDFKFNNKSVIFDLTADIKKYVKNNDESIDDILSNNKLIYKSEDIIYINNFLLTIKSLYFKYLDVFLKEKKIYANLINYANDSTDDSSLVFEIKVNRYDIEEYNLLKNKPTNILFEAGFYNNISDKKYKKAFIKNYKQMASIDYPLEESRVEVIIKKLALDSANYIKNNFLLSKRMVVNKNKKVKKENKNTTK